MQTSQPSFRARFLAAGAVLLLLIILVARAPEGTKSDPRESAPGTPTLADPAEPAVTAATPFPAPRPAPAAFEDPEPRPLANPVRQRLLDTSKVLARSERQLDDEGSRRLKSRLLATGFKFEHVRVDEVWQEQAQGAPVLVQEEIYVADHVMVRFPGAMSEAEVAVWCEHHGLHIRNRLRTAPVYRVATASPTLTSVEFILEKVRKSFHEGAVARGPEVIAEKDHLVFPVATPNDTSYNDLWGLHNTGQTGGTVDADIDAPEAWEYSTGSASVTVGVIDTGVDSDHIDLRDNIWNNPGETAGNGIDDDNNGFIDDVKGWDFYEDDNTPDDERGHGTHVAGTIGGTGNNGTGVVGVCWNVSLVPIRFLGPFGGSTGDAIDSVNYTTALGLDLTSNSWGGGSYSSLLEQAITDAHTAGILFVAAAGNDSRNNDAFTHYPASYAIDNVISVASTTDTDALSSFSNYGATSVHLAAPGSDIYSCSPGNRYEHASGTSMATPHVSGAAALLRSLAPNLSHLEVKRLLLENVDTVPALAGRTITGGRLNVEKAARLLSGPRLVPEIARIEITSGNGDPFLNPGETADFVFQIRNTGPDPAPGVTGTFTADSPVAGIGITPPSLAFGTLAPGAATPEFRVPVTVAGSVPTPTLASFTLRTTDTNGEQWDSTHSLEVYTSSTLAGRITSLVNGSPIPGALISYTGPLGGAVNTDASGNYAMVVIDGTYLLQATAPGFIDSSPLSISVPPSNASLEFQLGVPDLAISRLAINESVFAGSTSSVVIRLENRGTAALEWSAVANTAVGGPNALGARVLDGAPDPDGGPGGEQILLDPLAEESPSLLGKTIAILGNSGSFSSDLIDRGAVVLSVNLPFNSNTLDGVDVFVFDDAISSASTADITIIRDLVEGGGSLFATADNNSSIGNINAVLQGSGIVETYLSTFRSETLTSIFAHPTTEGVGSVALSSYGSGCTLTGSAVPLMQNAAGDVIAAASIMDRGGRVVALGNEIGSSLGGDGRVFVNQAFDWLARATRWLSTPNATGTLAPGEFYNLEVVFNTANLNAGVLNGEIVILSNEPGNPRTTIPVELTIIGSPAIVLDPPTLAFPQTFLQGTSTLDLRVENPGTDTLEVTGLTFSHPEYATTATLPFSVAPQGEVVLPVTFLPTTAAQHPATLTIANNSPTPSPVVTLSGQGVVGPNLSYNPGSFALTLPRGGEQIETFSLINTGDYNLDWTIELEEGTTPSAARDFLQESLDNLDLDFESITGLIPNRYDFRDGVTGQSISDGGLDMYDSGNFLSTDLGAGFFNYSDGVIAPNTALLGPNGRYFTRKHPGLFVFASELDGVHSFNITGGLGADGSGSVDGTVLSLRKGGRSWLGFVKRVSGAGDPSVNHLIIVEDKPGITHTYSTNTNDDTHSVLGLGSSANLYYLLFASQSGGRIDDPTMESIMDAFLETINASLPWLELAVSAGTVPPSGQFDLELFFSGVGIEPGAYGSNMILRTNDPSAERIDIPINLTVTPAAAIVVEPAPVDFGSIPTNAAAQIPLVVTNTGVLPLVLSQATTTGSAAFSVEDVAGVIVAPGASAQIQVLFSPTAPGSHAGNLVLTSNAGASPSLTIPLSGTAGAPSTLTTSPGKFDVTLAAGNSTTLPLAIGNTNAGPAAIWESYTRTLSQDSQPGLDLAGLKIALVTYTESASTNLATYFQSLGATTAYHNYSTIDTGVLAPYQLVVIDQYVENLSTTAVTDLITWTTNGGGLLIHSNSSNATDANTLLQNFGITAAYTGYVNSTFAPVGDHYLVEGLSNLTYGYSYHELQTSGGAVPLLQTTQDSVTRAAISRVGPAKVAMVTTNLGGGLTGDAQLFLGRLAGWLGNSTGWLEHSPDNGVLPAPRSIGTSVTFDATELFAGTYLADLYIESSTLAEPRVLPVRLVVTGTPDIAIASPQVLAFPKTYMGYEETSSFTIVNEGTAPLTVNSITLPHPELTPVLSTPFEVPPMATVEVPVRFTPTAIHNLSGNAVITSNDPDTPTVSVPVSGLSAIPPSILAPPSLSISAVSGQTGSTNFTLGNTGGTNLEWSLVFAPPSLDAPLETILPSLDTSHFSIIDLIPERFNFSDGILNNYISDGGSDMYDTGNRISTDLSGRSSYADYSDGVIAPGLDHFGPNSRYFTRKYEGLFLLAAELDGVNTFTISGGLGADGAGQADGAELMVNHRGINYRGFVKRVFGTFSEPSVNHLIIVEDKPGLSHNFPADTNSDEHIVSGLSGNDRLFYLVYAGSQGTYIDDTVTTSIMTTFLDSLAETTSWMSASPESGVTAPEGLSLVTATADASLLYAGTYETFLTVDMNDPARPSMTIPTTLTVTGTPEITPDPNILNFPATIVGAGSELDLHLNNSGTDVLTVQGILLTGPFSTATSFPLQVPPGERVSVPVTYTPTVYGFEAGIATITSDAANLPTSFINLYGLGIAPPIAGFDRSEMTISMGASTTTQDVLSIANTGNSNLHWEIGIDYGLASPLAQDVDLTGMNVLILSGSSTQTNFEDLVAALSGLGAGVEELYYPNFKPELLDEIDVLMTDGSYTNLLSTYHTAINSWVFNGGGLILTGVGTDRADFNAIVLGSDLELEYIGSGNPNTVPDIPYDITTVGVGSLETGGTTYGRFLTTGNGRALASWLNGDHYAAYSPLGAGRIIGMAGNSGHDSYVNLASNMRFLKNSTAWVGGRVRSWVEPVPASGTTGLNDATTVNFLFDSTGLLPGTYLADAVITSDDPARPEWRIPLTLEVTNAAEIVANPNPLEFAPLVAGLAETITVTLSNGGFGVLTISDATTSGDFSVDDSLLPIVLTPGSSETVEVTFAPTTVGAHSGTLVLTSDALTYPTLNVPLTGLALGVPEMSLSDSAFVVTAGNAAPEQRTLTISNAGPGHLSWKATETSNLGAGVAYPPDLTGVNIGFLTRSSYYPNLRTTLTSYGAAVSALVTPVQEATLESLDVLVVDDYYRSAITQTDHLPIRTWVQSGGALLLAAENVSMLETLLPGTGITPNYQYRSSYQTTNPSPHPVTTGITTVVPYYPEAYFTLSGDAAPLLSFTDGSVYAAAGELGRGPVIVAGNEALQDNDFNQGDGEQFIVQAMSWLADSLPWLEINREEGLIPPGGSDEIILTFDAAGLEPNNYQGHLVLETNDPAQTSVAVPLSFIIPGTPQISLSATTLDFGSVATGKTATERLTVSNVGTGALLITDLSLPAPYTVSTAVPIQIAGGNSAFIDVHFSPTAEGSHPGTLTVTSNSTTNGSATLSLSGSGVLIPEISFSTPSILINVPEGGLFSGNFPITNSGGANLEWTASFTSSLPGPGQLQGVRVLIGSVATTYATVANEFRSQGATVTQQLAWLITPAELANTDVLVLDSNISGISTANIAEIYNWIQAGGGFLCNASTSAASNNVQALLNLSGINPVYQGIPLRTFFDIEPHPITAGVSSLGGGYGYKFTVSQPAERLVNVNAAYSYAVASTIGSGRVVAVGGEVLRSNVGSGDWLLFGTQAVDWLSENDWFTFSPDAGIIPGGSSQDLTVTASAANLTQGTYSGSLEISSNDPATPLVTIPVTMVVTPASPVANLYTTWATGEFGTPPGNLGFHADWNGDGVSNGMEFYFDLDPHGPRDHGNLPAITSGNGTVSLTYTRRSDVPDALLRFDHSTDLVTWHQLLGNALNETIVTEDNGDGTTTVELEFVPTADERFFQYRVLEP